MARAVLVSATGPLTAAGRGRPPPVRCSPAVASRRRVPSSTGRATGGSRGRGPSSRPPLGGCCAPRCTWRRAAPAAGRPVPRCGPFGGPLAVVECRPSRAEPRPTCGRSRPGRRAPAQLRRRRPHRGGGVGRGLAGRAGREVRDPAPCRRAWPCAARARSTSTPTAAVAEAEALGRGRAAARLVRRRRGLGVLPARRLGRRPAPGRGGGGLHRRRGGQPRQWSHARGAHRRPGRAW